MAIHFADGSISYNKLLQQQPIWYLFENLILSSDSLSGTHDVWALMGIDQGLGTLLLSLAELNLSSCLTAAGQVSDSSQRHFPFRLPDRWQMSGY